jgi:hypothetical protein
MSFGVSPDVPPQEGGFTPVSLNGSFLPEVQTGDIGQRVFTLEDIVYTPGGNSLQVFCNGSLLNNGVDYAETSVTVVTLVNPLLIVSTLTFIAGAVVNATVVTDASQITYTPGGLNAVVTDVQTVLRTLVPTVSIKQFDAAAGSGGDDTAALTAAIATGANVYLPAGTYLISAQSSPRSNQTVFGEGAQTILKVAPGTYLSGSQFFSISSKDSVTIRDLTFDGNKGNIGTGRRQITTVFQSTNVTFRNVRFQNCEGICILLSTSASDFTVDHCGFFNCGGNPNNSDGYRRQGIAFSNGGAYRRIKLTDNTFSTQGLDSISLAGCFDVEISGNVLENVYSFVFSNPGTAQTCGNVNIVDNTVDKAGEFGVVSGSVPANTIGLTYVNGGVIAGNTFNTLDCGAISIGANCTSFEVVGNVIVNPGQATTLWICGINIGGSQIASNTSNITVSNNTVVDTNGTALMQYGIIVADDAANVFIKDNNVKNWLTGKYGKYPHTAGVFGNVTPLTSNTGVVSTVFIHDIDIANGVQTSWRAMNTLANYQINGALALSAGVGSPNGAVTASPGSLYLNTSGGAGTTLYVKESGAGTNTGWVGK